MSTESLSREFFNRPTLQVAPALLGQRLVRAIDGELLKGRIVETEAYIGQADSACHASRGRTPRNEVMFGPPGRAYIYLVYGLHSMLNLVTEPEGMAGAVLIRALEPVAGLETIRTRRAKIKREIDLTNGPGKLCHAFAIDRSLNRWDVTLGHKLWLEPGPPPDPAEIATGPRIGINYAQPEDRAAPWRFWIRENRFVSRR